MESRNRFYIFSFLFTIIIIQTSATKSNETSLNDSREPRVTGRIVQLYSGTDREPIICVGEGFQADVHDCSIFYRCMKSGNGKYTVFRFKCGPGTIYDPETEVCNYPHSTKRSECGGFRAPSTDRNNVNEIDEGPQEIPSPISTNAPIYTEHTTQNNTKEILNKLTEVPTLTTIKTEIYPSATSSISDAYPFMTSIVYQKPQDFDTSKTPDLAGPTSSIGKQESQSDENICTTDGFIGDSQNCHKFYRCVANQRNGYTRYEFSCSDSTIWDEDIQSCNHAWAVKRTRCARKNDVIKENIISVQTLVSDKPAQHQLQISNNSKVSQTQTQISDESLIQNQMQNHFGDRMDINKNSNSKEITHNTGLSQSSTQIHYGDAGLQTQQQVDHSQQPSLIQNQVYESITQGTSFSYASSEKTNKNNECVRSGFMGDFNDCKKFYRCVDNGRSGYTRFEFSCGEGTVWDQAIEACNHAWAVKECGRKLSMDITNQTAYTSTPNVYTSTQKGDQTEHNIEFVDSYHTTSYNYSTNNEDTVYGNQNQHTTIFSSTVTETFTTEPSSSVDTGYGSRDPQYSSILTTTSTAPQTHAASSDMGTKCNSSGFIGDANDCKIFYRCVENGKGFTKYEFKCGEGTVWDPSIEACNHAWAVNNCGSSTSTDILKGEQTTIRYTTPTVDIIKNITDTTTIKPLTTKDDDNDTGYRPQINDLSSSTSTTKQPQNTINNIGNVCKFSGFMGDDKDCKKFYRCVDNSDGSFIRYEFSCGEGTVWDSEIEACNHAWAVKKCGGNGPGSDHQHIIASQPPATFATQTSSSSTENYEHSTITTYTYSTIPSSTTAKQSTLVTDSNNCIRSGFIGDNKDCKKFYRCVDNGKGYTRYEFSCGEGTVWDSKIEACNHAWAVEDCGGSVGSTSNYVSTPSSQTNKNDTHYENYPPIEQTQGIEFSTASQSITIQSTTEPIKTDSGTRICKSNGFIGDKNDCTKFYRCVDDGKGAFILYEFNCGEGTLWDQSIEACNHAWAVNNCGKHENNTQITTVISTSSQPQHIAPSIINSPTSAILISSTTLTELSTTANTEAQHSTEKIETTSSSSSAQCTSEGFFAHPHNCKKFIRCVSNNKNSYIMYEFSCGEGTVWVQEIQACDHDSNDLNCNHQFQSTTRPQNTIENHTNYVSETTVTYHTPASGNRPTGEEHNSNVSVTTEMSTKPQTTDKLDDKNDSGTYDKPSESIKCTSEGFYGNKNNCRQFYRCVDNGQGGYVKYDYTCGEGTAWDSEILTCNHIDQVKTCYDLIQESTEPSVLDSQTTVIASISSTSKTTPSYGSTQKTSTATSGSSQGLSTVLHESSQGASTASSGSSQETSTALSGSSQGTATTSTGSSETGTKESCKKEGYFGDTKDCTKFYRCVDNGKGGYTKYDFTCGEGTVWDPDLTTCNHPQDVAHLSCSQSEDSVGTGTTILSSSLSSSSTTQPTSSSQSTSQSTAESETQGISNCSQEESSKKPINTYVNCTKAGYYPNPNDCKKFYRCVDWNGDGTKFSVYHFECGEGTIWDPEIETCNHEDSVYPPRDCSGAQSNENGNQTTTTASTTIDKDETTISQITTTSQSPHNTEETTTQSSEHTTSEKTTTQQLTTEQTTSPSSSSMQTTTPYSTTSEQTTTQQSSTSEQTTTQQSTTSEPTTIQQSTTSKPTMTQQSTTSESTTTEQSTTSESSTTPHSTTSEQTTTQQSTTSEQTTTQQMTTSEPTTTQQSTTSEQTTTQQSTTSEPTTTQQSTTSEPTTTQQSTTSEQTTTQQSTTFKPTTTQQSPTSEQTSTQQSTTSEQTTTQQYTTSEQTTTQQSTTEETTTQQSTTLEQSIQVSTTTEQTTKPQSTTQQSTTVEASTTEHSTSSAATENTERPTTTTTSAVEQKPTEGTSSQEECPEIDDDQYMFVCPTSFRRHPKYCNMFYQCTAENSHDVKIATFTCPNSTIYDESKIKCVEESEADKKCNAEIIQSRSFKRLGKEYRDPIVVTEESYACTTTGYFSFEKDIECSPVFLKCKTHKSKLRSYVYQCPAGYYYWSRSKRCEKISKLIDCKRSSNNWSGRWEIPIEINNVATS